MVLQAHGKRSSRFSLLLTFAAVLATSGFALPVGLGTVLDKDKQVVEKASTTGHKACQKQGAVSRSKKNPDKSLGFGSFSRWFL